MNANVLQTLLLALVQVSLVPRVTGDCLHSGSSYLNSTVWQPDPCSVCTCEDPVVLCELVQCTDPQCSFKQGERLQIAAGGCCPVCVGQLSPCQFEGTSVSHNTEWRPSQCVVCYCDDGVTSCSNVTCPLSSCKPGEVSQRLPGQCCPKCIPSGRSCIGSDGKRFSDGSEWSPLPCSKCVCRDGLVTCYPVLCDVTVCPAGTTLKRSNNSCCPECVYEKCLDVDQEFEHGDQWQRDSCTFCSCHKGATVCHTRQCVQAQKCSRTEKLITRPGECCPECILKKSVCADEHPVRYHGDIWNVSRCEYCVCKQSHVECRRATCEYLNCQKGEVLQQKSGRCCPQCVKPQRCLHGEVTYQEGDTWHPDPCSVCNCEEGAVTCYKRSCPLCPHGTDRSLTQGQCCGQCTKVECSSACSECLPASPQHCVRCQEFGKLAQDGKCVDRCRDSFYPQRDNTCQACDQSCQSCVDGSPFHCLTCRPGRFWKQGSCVEQCGLGYYLRNSQCLACHSTCSSCSGSGRSQCLACSYAGHVLHQGRCVDSCGSRFFLQSRECFACPPFCRTCQPDSAKCATCHGGTVIVNGNCLPACPKGFYSRHSGCTACHPSCATCSRGHPSSCLSCHHGYDLHRGTCRSFCSEGKYLTASGQCKACGQGCRSCYPDNEGSSSVCSECTESSFVPTATECAAECKQGLYLEDRICKGCDKRCRRCKGPGHCTQCLPPFVLADGHCVQTCGQQRHPDSNRICRPCGRHCLQCTEAECEICDSRTFLRAGACVGVCGAGFIADHDNRRCQENVSPPNLQVSGVVYVTEGSVVTIPTDMFHLSDPDTPSDQLRLRVLRPPDSGHLVKALHGRDQVIGQEDYFTLEDLRDGKVRFVHSHRTRSNDKVILRATDGALYSEEAFFVIQVTAKEPPGVVRNRPLTAVGGDKTVIRRTVLDFQSSGSSIHSKIYVLQGPLHGRVVNARTDRPVSVFSLDELRRQQVAYFHHRNSTSLTDMVILQFTDGMQQINTILNIIVRPENSKIPVVINNRGGRVVKGDMMVITKEMLQVSSVDPANVRSGDVIYTLVPSAGNPKQGEVIMVVPIPSTGVGRGWQELEDGLMAAKMYRFLQRDIDEERIYYRNLHTGTTSDVFTFEVADTSAPPNILKGQRFQITILDESIIEQLSEPTLSPGVKLGMTVLENQIVPITSENLAYVDSDTKPGDLIYRITTLLGEGEGTVENIDVPFQPVLRFSQTDIDSNKIIYRPPDTDIGMHDKEVSFSFVVTDGGRERRLPEQKFTIRVIPVNNLPPQFRTTHPELTVAQGGSTPVSQVLQVSDGDSPLASLTLTLTQEPSQGHLERLDGAHKSGVETGDVFRVNELSESSLQYVHSGSDTSLADEFQMSVSDGDHQTVTVVKLRILKTDKSAPYMLPSASCHLNVSEGELSTLTSEHLQFGDDDELDEGIIITLSSKPIQGRLLLKNRVVPLGGGFSQDDINHGRVSFKAEEEIGSQPVTELLYFNVSDSSRNLLPNQVLSVFITPQDNQSPMVAVGPDIEVEEGGEVQLTRDTVQVLDIDSPLSRLFIVIDTPPSFGVIVNRKPVTGSESNRMTSVDSFRLTDMFDGHVHYEQRDHLNKEPAWDNVLFHLTDGANRSPTQRLNISITLVNDEPPHMITEQLFVSEGKSILLTNASLYVIDLDTQPDDLLFTLTLPPTHGFLKKKEFTADQAVMAELIKHGSTFSYQDVLNELILYHHNDGDAMTDVFHLRVTDGDFSESTSLNVIVGLVNDETPRVTVNRGLRIQSGSTTPIKASDLRAADIDSDDASIVYTVRRDPTAGHVLYNDNQRRYVLSADTHTNTFTQDDLNKGHIFFVHELGEATGNIIFKFKLSDPEGNELIDQDFFITVLEDHFPPKQIANKEFSITEGTSRKITTDFLSFTDVDSEPGSLQYTVLSGLDLGHLELTKQPGVPVSEFTQADLAANSLLYAHTSPNETYMDKFLFIVSDGSNEIVKTFYINILPIDDSIPMVVNRGLQVQEGVRKLITEFDLKAVDYDTKEDKIVFTIVQSPVHGTVDLRSVDGVHLLTSAFTMEDVYENRVSYEHDGTENFEDNFSFTVSDGTNEVFVMQQDEPSETMNPISSPQKFDIRVLPLDDGMPVLQTNLGLQFLEFTGSQVSNLITDRELKASDQDTPEENIIFLVQDAPTHGQLEHVANPGRVVRTFSQDDLNKGMIRYVLATVTDVYQDSFTFDLMDAKPNVVPGNTFHIMWSVVQFEKPRFNVTETAGVIQIPVVRKGNLKQYSIVTCRTVPGAATSKLTGARPGHKDFMAHVAQVQFDDWQDTKPCSIVINDDSIFEGPETFYVELSSPTYALLGDTAKTAVTIYDTEDEPEISFKQNVYHVDEGDAYLMAALTRTGDLSSTVSVICFTTSLTATGSSLTGLESGSDYISRGKTNSYRVVFPQGVTEATCDVKLIDDSEFETSEQFDLGLMEPAFPARLGPIAKATAILDGPNDESMIFLSLPLYSFEESAGVVQVEVLRMGSDLGHSSVVWCATRLSDPPSATPGQDYVPSSSQITFGPGQTSQTCQLTILDDDFDPRREGNETFVVFLSSATGSTLAEPHLASVVIHDSTLDIPRMTFVQEDYVVDESDGTVNITILRTGDVSCRSSAVCYTRQQTARVMMDFDERILGNASRVTFLPGEKLKNCTVRIVNDNRFEPEETFHVRLTQPLGTEDCEAELGHLDRTTVTITNHDDVPTIQFAESAYSVNEPSEVEQMTTVTLRVVRTGDLNTTSSVRCSTRDGSAQSGSDYNPKSLVLKFPPGLREVEFAVDVLYNSDVEWHETLTVRLGPEPPDGAMLGPTSSATVTILDNEVSGSTILPAQPMVVSLLYYDDVEQGLRAKPSPGYPLVCVTPCDIHSPVYPKTHTLCDESGIEQSRMLYSWEVAAPADDADDADADDALPPFVEVSDSTLFTRVDRQVLDSIHFRSHFRVRCVAQPLHASNNGNPGVPLKSRPVTIGNNNGICNAPAFDETVPGYHAQSFLAGLEYVGPADGDHPNTIHISVEIPHHDGLLPLISTFPIHNLRLLLAEPVYRQQHVCSNMITARERKPLIDEGFFSGKVSEPLPYGPGFDFPFQFDDGVRENETISLYEHLNLKSCLWRFDAWYHMTELVDICGGRVVSDFKVKDSGRTHLTVKVPLFVSYLYTTAPVGWGSLEHRSEMEFSFYYDTMKWRAGLETGGRLGGKLQVLKILIRDDGKLVVSFRTTAKFRGMYVYEHNTMPGIRSHVVPPENLAISFDLKLVWSQQTFDSPHQMWEATSTFNLKDYTGLYTIELIPCSVKSTQRFVSADPIPCTGQPIESFKVPISFQQTNRPVPLIYSLNTEFQLTNNLKMFLLDPTSDQVTREDWDFNGVYSEGQTIYGRVLWNPEQDLKEAYKLNIEKVYLCTGANGYIPTFDPVGEVYKNGPQFGCIQPSPKLKHRFLILDYQNSDVTERHFHDVAFEAEFASESAEYSPLSDMPGVDGFTMSVDPLYKVDAGHQWYLQVVYIIGPADKIHPRFRRSAVIGLHKRDASLARSELRNGTNMASLQLDDTQERRKEDVSSSMTSIAMPAAAGVVGVVLLTVLVIIVIVFVKRRRRKRRKEIPAKPNNLVTAKDSCDEKRWSMQWGSDSKRNTLTSVLDVKTNVVKTKQTNVENGNNLDTGTEV